ncbi:MAG: hypothetical protein ACSHX2_09855 [Rubritalea sp.]
MSTASLLAKLPPLPTWDVEDKERVRKGEIIVGRGLLTDELQKQQAEKKLEVEVIIEAVQEKPQLPGMEILSGEAVISAAYLEKYFGQTPEGALVDPQQLLSMQERADMEYVLEQHGNESKIPFYVYLFDAKQQLPEGYSPQAVYDKAFAWNQKPIVIVYYYLGTPERSEFLLAGGPSDDVPGWQVRELLWNSAHKAREKSDIFDQLGSFVGQLSMRLFWVEEILNELRHQIIPPQSSVETPEQATDKVSKLLGVWENTLEPHVMQAIQWILIAVVVAGGALFVILRRRFKFPETPSPARLGGGVGGKSGGILRYRDSRVPPSMQRKQIIKDFL